MSDEDFTKWFANKEFYLWTSGNYLDSKTGDVESADALKQRIVYQLAVSTQPGRQSEYFFEMNMAEVKIKHEGDQVFGDEKPEPRIVQKFLNS